MPEQICTGVLESVIAKQEAVVGKLRLSSRCWYMSRRIADDYFVTSNSLGFGCNGHVHLASSRAGGGRFAVKSFSLRSLSIAERAELETEVGVALSVDHPNIVRAVDVYEADGRLDLVMECLEGPELYDMVQQSSFSECRAASAIGQTLLALAHMHSRGIVHRDVKLENIKYERDGSDHLKIMDFGVSGFLKDGHLEGDSGTDDYKAPEVWRGRCTDRGDLWSVGVVAFILLSGRMPFSGGGDVLRKRIMRGQYSMDGAHWGSISSEACEFVKSLLEVHATRRISAQEAITHPWIADAVRPDAVHSSTLSALQAFPCLPPLERRSLAIIALSLKSKEEEALRGQFMAIDMGRRGSITLEELQELCSSSGDGNAKWIEEAFTAICSSRAANGVNEIFYTDFLAAMIPAHVQVSDGMLRAAFRKFDTDPCSSATSAALGSVLDEFAEGTDTEGLMCEGNLFRSDDISFDAFVAFMRRSQQRQQITVSNKPKTFFLPCLLGQQEWFDNAKVGGTKTWEGQLDSSVDSRAPAGFQSYMSRSCADSCTVR